jgi:hypothetical protein
VGSPSFPEVALAEVVTGDGRSKNDAVRDGAQTTGDFMTSQAYRAGRTGQASRHTGGSAVVILLTLIVSALSLFLFAAGESAAVNRNGRSLYGPAVTLGNGTVRTYIEMEGDVPIEVGVALSRSALDGLPGPHDPGGVEIEPHHFSFEQVLELPSGNPTPFRHVTVNWNPGGHEPPGIYDRAHFDFHFNMISDAERRTITRDDPAFDAKAERHPAARYMPAGYVAIPGAVPMMGAHWIDPQSPELHGQPFTQTFIFGTWDGRLIFAEPMITKAYLESEPDFEATLPVPERVEQSGYYPARYGIRWDEAAQEYRISLEALVHVR